LPLTGAWTASLCAFLFGIPYKKSLPMIFSGLVIAGLIMVLLSLAGADIIKGIK